MPEMLPVPSWAWSLEEVETAKRLARKEALAEAAALIEQRADPFTNGTFHIGDALPIYTCQHMRELASQIRELA